MGALINTALPNPNYPSGPPESDAWGNTVICATTSQKYTYPEHNTPYLFVTNYIGEGSYTINNRATGINHNIFYLLQPGSRLAIHFKANQPLQTLMILFNSRFVTGVIGQRLMPQTQLLDGGGVANLGHTCPQIPAVPFMVSAKLQALLGNIRGQSIQSQAAMHSLLAGVVDECCIINTGTAQLIQKLQAVKTSTRQELYRRLNTAVVFMHDNVCHNVSLNDIAMACSLNSFHFLRMFKQAYGTTPHQYMLRLKLEKAEALLKTHRLSVTDVCAEVGFESIGSFSNLFKKRFGVSPSRVAMV